jgi:hypothetical protein
VVPPGSAWWPNKPLEGPVKTFDSSSNEKLQSYWFQSKMFEDTCSLIQDKIYSNLSKCGRNYMVLQARGGVVYSSG